MKKVFTCLFLVFLTACSSIEQADEVMGRVFTITADEFKNVKLSYYSDYFSFVGEDPQGMVFFAMDNNRGQDGDSWQAEHFLAFFDESEGWVKLQGNGDYRNLEHELEKIPNSEFFSFQGSPEKGIIIESKINKIKLEVNPIDALFQNDQGISRFRMGAVPATLHWRDRIISGRLIYEGLFFPAFNRLSRTYLGAWNDFHGFYLKVEDAGDLYIHIEGSISEDIPAEQTGFLIMDGEYTRLESVKINVINRQQALGFYQWPLSWQGSFTAGDKQYQFSARLEHRDGRGNWIIGGFSMGIIRGEISADGKIYKITGLGELII